MNIGERLLEVRKEKGLSQKALPALGVSKGAISSHENAVQVPGSAIIAAVCERFDIEPRWLLLGEGPMHSEPVDAPDGSMLGHNLRVEATEAHVKDLEAELERIKKELLAAHIERDRAKEEAYKAMKMALKAHGSDIDKE